MWWIRNLKRHQLNVPQYFILQLVFQYIFHEGVPKKPPVTEEGSERTFRGLSDDHSSCFFKEFRTLQLFFPGWSPDSPSALRVTSHYSLDRHVPWMTRGLQTVPSLLRWLAPLSQMAAAPHETEEQQNSSVPLFRFKRSSSTSLCLCGSGTEAWETMEMCWVVGLKMGEGSSWVWTFPLLLVTHCKCDWAALGLRQTALK